MSDCPVYPPTPCGSTPTTVITVPTSTPGDLVATGASLDLWVRIAWAAVILGALLLIAAHRRRSRQ